MHVFEHFEKNQLKKIIRNYNLHVKIARYSKLDKDELIGHMKNYLFINNEGRIMVKDEVLNKADDEMNKIEPKKEKKVKEPKPKKEPKKKEPKAKKEEPKPEPKKEEPKKQETVADMTPRFLLRAYFLLLNCRSMQAGSQTKYNIINANNDKKELEFLKNKYNFSKKEDIKPELEKHIKMPNMVLKDFGLSTYHELDQEYKCFSKSYKGLHKYLLKLVEQEKAKEKPAPKETPKPPAKAKKEPKPKPAKKEKPAPIPKAKK
jgi:hypothetical protein